jgi:hypothetical protein
MRCRVEPAAHHRRTRGFRVSSAGSSALQFAGSSARARWSNAQLSVSERSCVTASLVGSVSWYPAGLSIFGSAPTGVAAGSRHARFQRTLVLRYRHAVLAGKVCIPAL